MTHHDSGRGIFDPLGDFVSRHWAAVLLGWIAFALLIVFVAPRWDDVTRDGDFAYLPSRLTSVRGQELLAAAFPRDVARSQVALLVARGDDSLRPGDYAVADELAGRFLHLATDDGPLLEVLSYSTPVIGEGLKSPSGPHGQMTIVLLRLRNEFMAVGNSAIVRHIYGVLDEIRGRADFPPGLELGVTGSAAIGGDMFLAVNQSIRNTEWTTVTLVILILLAVYRAPGLVVVPLLTIVAALVVSMGLVALAAQWSGHSGWFDFKIFKTTRIFVVVTLFGAGTDFCLFVIARYREELLRGRNSSEALAAAVGRVGGAVTASAMTTILGLAMMVCCEFGKFRNSGPTIAACLAVTLLASLTLAPALLRALGRVAFWPLRVEAGSAAPQPTDGEDPSPAEHAASRAFWQWLAGWVLARPGAVLLGSLLVLLPVAWLGSSWKETYDLFSDLGADCPSVRGARLLGRHFPAGQVSPVTLLVSTDEGQLDAPDARDKIQRLITAIRGFTWKDAEGASVRPVQGIRSLLEPLGSPAKKRTIGGMMKKEAVRAYARRHFVSEVPPHAGKLIRFDLILGSGPFAPESIRFLDEVEKFLGDYFAEPESGWRGARFCLAGTAAEIRDLKNVTTADFQLIQKAVPLVVLLVLVVIFRRPLVCVFLVLSVLLGYYVSIAATEAVFTWIYGADFAGIDWKVPIFLFILLIAVGEDYNIYLVSRVTEEQKRYGLQAGLRAALVQTGGIITSCGIIMAGTFAAMMTGTLRAVVELGFALSFGVLLDTLLIRTVLVPAFLQVWQRRTG